MYQSCPFLIDNCIERQEKRKFSAYRILGILISLKFNWPSHVLRKDFCSVRETCQYCKPVLFVTHQNLHL